MKEKWILLLWLLILGLLTGCAGTTAQQSLPVPRSMAAAPSFGGTAATKSNEILENIWENYRAEERFLVFGGDAQNLVADGPGDLDAGDRAMLQQRFFLTEALCGGITEGAALEHRLNRNVFCAGVFRITESIDPIQMALQWKTILDQTQWQGARPQRYLITQPEPGFLLLVYGQTSILETFLIRMNQAYPKGQIFVYQEIPQKIPSQGLQQANLGTAWFYRTERFWIHRPRLIT